MEYLAAANAAMALLKVLMPEIQELRAKGQITPEQQDQVRGQYVELRDHMDEMFTGPEWDLSTKPTGNPGDGHI
jgi:hypothetical protein